MAVVAGVVAAVRVVEEPVVAVVRVVVGVVVSYVAAQPSAASHAVEQYVVAALRAFPDLALFQA